MPPLFPASLLAGRRVELTFGSVCDVLARTSATQTDGRQAGLRQSGSKLPHSKALCAQRGSILRILVPNLGSTSLKYQLIETEGEKVLARGKIERIGSAESPITTLG